MTAGKSRNFALTAAFHRQPQFIQRWCYMMVGMLCLLDKTNYEEARAFNIHVEPFMKQKDTANPPMTNTFWMKFWYWTKQGLQTLLIVYRKDCLEKCMYSQTWLLHTFTASFRNNPALAQFKLLSVVCATAFCACLTNDGIGICAFKLRIKALWPSA